MRIYESSQIPHQPLRPFFNFWGHQRGRRLWPRRDEITLDELRSAAANTAFCRIDRPYRDLDSLCFVNVGTAVEQAIGRRLTGMSVGQLLREVGSSPEFTYCFSEYGQAATEGGCSYNEGRVPWPDHTWLAYRRLVLPLGAGGEPDMLFVVIDLNAVGLELKLPETLRDFDVPDDAPEQPWSAPALRITTDASGTDTAPRD